MRPTVQSHTTGNATELQTGVTATICHVISWAFLYLEIVGLGNIIFWQFLSYVKKRWCDGGEVQTGKFSRYQGRFNVASSILAFKMVIIHRWVGLALWLFSAFLHNFFLIFTSIDWLCDRLWSTKPCCPVVSSTHFPPPLPLLWRMKTKKRNALSWWRAVPDW